MSRVAAILLLVFALGSTPAFSQEIDPATGLSRSTIVRPLQDVPGLHELPPPKREEVPARREEIPADVRPHVALILPTLTPGLGPLAEAVRLGFIEGAHGEGRGSPPVTFTAIENEARELAEACRRVRRAGAQLVVAGLTRDGATALAQSDCARLPVLALNEPQIPTLPPRLFHISLSLEHEARQVALLAVADGWRSAIVIASPSALARRVQEAFEREWVRAAGELRRVTFSGQAEDAPLVRERLAQLEGDIVFLALDAREARAVRPYVSGMLPVYATSFSVDPRAEPSVNVDLQGVRYVDMPWFVQPDHAAVMVYPPPRGRLSVEQERLYALGIDAFRLSLLVLRGDPESPVLDGVTGRITLGPGNAFLRALTPAEVDGGRVHPLRPR